MSLILLKAGMADAMDYAMTNGEWTLENDIAALLFFVGIPLICLIYVIPMSYFVIKSLIEYTCQKFKSKKSCNKHY